MTTPLYPIMQKRIWDALDVIIRTQLEPWVHFNSGHPVRVTAFDGRQIGYEGGGFEGSPRLVFWSRYIEPFLEDLAVNQILIAVREARERGVDGNKLLSEVEGLLLAACRKVYARMANIDRRLLARGFPEKVPLRSTDREYQAMQQFIEMHIRAERQMWKPENVFQLWYERHTALTWAIGILVAIVGAIIGLLQIAM